MCRILLFVRQTGERWRLGHVSGLDGLRGVAILLVLVDHFFEMAWLPVAPLHALGAAGVSLFFALSGFLITGLLLEEAQGGRISLRLFYRNRALRLAPAAVAAVTTLTVLEVIVRPGSESGLLYVVTYSANWAMANGHQMLLLSPMWSLAVEEQFYLLWPLVVVLLVRRGNWLLGATVVGLGASLVARFTSTGLRTYYGSDTQAAGLLVGCLLAILATRGLSPRLVPRWFVPVGLVALASTVLVSSFRVGDLWVPALVPFLGVGLIWSTCSQTDTILELSVLRYLGSRSYALYLWHFGILYAVAHVWVRSWALEVLALAAVFAIAEGSWWVVELPFLRRKVSRSGASMPEDAPVRSHASDVPVPMPPVEMRLLGS